MFTFNKAHPAPTPVDTGVRGYLQMHKHFASGRPLPQGFNYNSMHDFVLDRGRTYPSEALTPAEQNVLKAAVGRRKFLKKECFYNAHMLVMQDMTDTLVYTEGWAFGGLVSVHHGWVTLNGKVVDLTWDKEGQPIMGTLPEGWEYYGVEFDKRALLERMARTGRAMSVIDDYRERFPVLQWDRLSPP